MTDSPKSRNAAESPKDRAAVPATDSQVLITPPPSEPLLASTTAGSAVAAAPARAVDEERMSLFPSSEANALRARWDDIQVGFVDEPRRAVAEADALVATAMSRLTEVFTRERQRLEQPWERGEDASTEDLRLALRRYRSFFGRLLSI
jgi:hypothetical protein